MPGRILEIFFCALLFLGTAASGDRWHGIQPGPHGVGFRFQHTVDTTRNIDSVRPGTPLGLAIWYPSSKRPSTSTAMTQLDYKLLQFLSPLGDRAKQDFLDAEAAVVSSWRHLSIVPLTPDQARTAILSGGQAVRDAQPAGGRFPLVLILGGAWYLSTTAEILASHGYVVVAPVRYEDVSNEIPTLNFSWFVENAVRDAEWALAEMRRHPWVDASHVFAIGHGGGGLQALMLAMHNRAIGAVVNIDSANFSQRTNPRQLSFYHPRLLRVPYLNILTAATRRDLDLYAEFEDMRFSSRYEVILDNPALRHHDLSDVGRPVSATLGIRGEAQDAVLRNYADVQQTLVRFLDAHTHGSRGSAEHWSAWMKHLSGEGDYSVALREAVEPAPTLVQVLHQIDEGTVARLRDAHRRDPDAPLFEEDQLQHILDAARLRGPASLAAGLGGFSLELHPKSLPPPPNRRRSPRICGRSSGGA